MRRALLAVPCLLVLPVGAFYAWAAHQYALLVVALVGLLVSVPPRRLPLTLVAAPLLAGGGLFLVLGLTAARSGEGLALMGALALAAGLALTRRLLR